MHRGRAAGAGSADRARPRRRRRWWRRIAFLLVVAAVVIIAVALFALRTPPGRRAVLARVAGIVEERVGASITADDFSIALFAAELEIEGLTLRAVEPGAPPFATSPRAHVDFRWDALFDDVIVIDSVRLDRPHVDLDAPVPRFGSGKPKEDDDPGADTTIELPEIMVLDGTIQGTLPESLDVVGDAWSASGVGLRASWLGDRLRVSELEGRLKLDGTRRPAVEASVATRLTLDREAVLDIESLELTADGMSAEGALIWDVVSQSVRELRLDLDAEPARLFPDLVAGGHVKASALLAIEEARLSGSLRATVERFPAELLSPVLDPLNLERLDPAGSWLDVDADLEIAVALSGDAAPHRADSFVGHADVVWRRPQERLLTASLRAVPPPEILGIAFDAELLPDDSGRRHVEGVLTAPSWLEIADGSLRDAQFDVDLPDLADAARRLGFGDGDIGGWRPDGELSASGNAAGPVRAPRVDVTARMARQGAALVELDAATKLSGGDEAAILAFDVSLLSDSPGRRHAEGELRLAAWDDLEHGELSDLRIVLDVPDVATAVAELDALSAELFPGLPISDRVPEAEWLQGNLQADVSASGALTSPRVDGVVLWDPAEGETVRLEVDGCVGIEQPFLDGSAVLDVEGLDVARFIPEESALVELTGHLDATLELHGDSERMDAGLTVEGRELSWRDVAIDRLAVSAAGNVDAVEVSSIEGVFRNPSDSIESRLSGRASFAPAWPPQTASLDLTCADPVQGIESARVVARLEDGTVHLDPLELIAFGHPATLRAAMPLSSLSPDLGARFGAAGGVELRLQFDDLDLGTLLALAGTEDFPIRGRFDGAIEIDPADIFASSGTIDIENLAFVSGDDAVAADVPLRLHLEDGRLVLEPTQVAAEGALVGGRTPLEISGAVELNTDWEPQDGVAGLIRNLTFDFAGTVDARLLRRYAGADGTDGHLVVEGGVSGSLDDLEAEVHIQGPEARLTYHSPYPARIEQPDIRVRVAEGTVHLERATGLLNNGAMELRGTLDTESGETRLDLTVDEARFRLDYGIVAILDANLRFDWSAADRGRLSGLVVVERGVLRRDLFVDREVLRMVADSSLIRADNPLHDRIDIDLAIDTAEGMNVKNNVADIHVHWNRLQVGGTFANPTLDGRVDVNPGGWLWILGQTWRVEEVALEWSGGPISDGRVIFDATSSAQDPSLKQKSRGFWHAGLGDVGPGRGGSLDFWSQSTGQNVEEATAGLATYYQNRLASALGSGVNTVLSYEALPLLGETDNQARFTVAQQLSPNVTFIASTNPRDAEGQTYIVDLLGIPPWPGFRTQLFTNDQGNEGITMQQTLLLGSGSGDEASGPTLAKTTADAAGVLKPRKVKRATGYRKGDPFPPGAGLDVEVDVTDWMGRKGFPTAAVAVDWTPTKKGAVDLHVAVDPGPRVRHEFEGEKLPKRARRDIAAVFRPGEIGTNPSVDAVRDETVRIMRGLGHLDPEVEVWVETDEEGQILRVRTASTRRIAPGPPIFDGVPDEASERVAAQFRGLGARVELAAGIESADRRVLRILRDLGWPGAVIESRELSDDGDELTVSVTPGRRQHIASLEIAGIDSDEAVRLAKVVQVSEGDPADFGRVVLSSRTMEDVLHDEGNADARVRTDVRPIDPEDPYELAVRFRVDRGASFRLADVRYEGMRASKPRWVAKKAGLEPGGALRSDEIAEARGRLYQTGVFRRIDVRTEEVEVESDAVDMGADVDTTVTFDLEESQRYQLAYGGRWESNRGLSAVVDLIDTNSLGRGHTSGVRLIYGEEKKRLRFYHMIPRIIGPKTMLELFVEGRDDLDEIGNVTGIEAWAQLTFPVVRRHQMRVYAVFETREVDLLDPDIESDDQVLSPRLGWQAVFSSLGTGLATEQRKGWFVGLDLSGASKALGSDATSVSSFTQFKYFLPTRWLTWAQSWRTGLLTAIDAEVPFADRLRAGGEFSVRGYTTNTLGPLDPDGVPLGGEVLFVVNQELHRRIWRGLYGLVFFDAGNVWLTRDTVDSELFKSVGVGLRYSSPVGPLRVDVGFPLDQREGIDDDYAVYFGFGTVF